MASTELLAGIGSVLAVIISFLSLAINNHETITLWMNKIRSKYSNYIQITIPEYGGERPERSDLYVAVQAYLSYCSDHRVRKLTAEVMGSDSATPLLFVDDGQQIVDTFRGSRIWWHGYKEKHKTAAKVIYERPGQEDSRRFYRVSFHRRFRKTVVESYLPDVIAKGRLVIASSRQRRLYTNNTNGGWIHVVFQHPATFDTLAMDPELKKKIVDDLRAFHLGKDYYARVGKPWKRGYLLFGPPGTGKSALVSSMARFMDYDIYKLELTAVRSNNDLRRLFIDTTGKSIIVVEDIDRFVDDLTKNQRAVNVNRQPTTREEEEEQEADSTDGGYRQQLTLTGLLDFMDGLWSAMHGGERIIVFTTTNRDRLDPVLIRPGRMDMHIQMSYCTYETFKVLANNYLDINEQDLFLLYGEIQDLLPEAEMSPAEVAQHLMRTEINNATACLKALVVALKQKVEAASKESQKSSMGKAEAVQDQ